MAHARQTIREAAATLLTNLTTTGSRVFQSRMAPQESLPCLLITTNDEEVTPGTISGMAERHLELAVTGCAKSASNVDDTLDTIAAEVETAMAGFTYRNELTRLEVDFDEAVEKPAGRIVLTFRITYLTAAGSPGTPI
jgi:hypothetical protein